MANESNCLTQDLLIGLLQDSLSKEEQLRAAEHVQTCQVCQKELETICEQRKIGLPESTSVENDQTQDSIAEWSGKLAQRLMAELQQDGPSPPPQPADMPSMATIISTEEEPSATEQTVERGAVDSETSVTKQHSSRSDSPTELHISEMFGRYKVEKILGQGAMGAVYLARDTQLDRDVALKIPKFGSGNNVDDQELLERFYREARAAATLRSPHICPVYDVGEINGQHYITMAYIEGRPLKDFTKSKKKHSEKQIATTVRKLAQGLAEAHEIGVVHRDLKPANVMVDRKGEPVVMDFGLARRSSSDDVQVTQSGAIMGTPAYMSPEQVEGDQDKIGPQADIYALGIIMYELITGDMPYKGSLMSILQQIALNNPEKPSKLRPDIDLRLEKICLKMMAGDLTKRYRSMEEVASDLQDVMRTPLKKSKQQASSNKSPKQTSIPTATEESNPALISIEPQSITEQLREKRGTSGSKSRRKPSSGSSSSGVNKNLLIAGGVIGLLLLMGIVFLVRVGKYDVQITLDDPSITLSVDGEKLNINDGQNVIQLSAGPHKLQLEKDGLKTQVEEFTVTKDGKTALTAKVVNGKLDAVLGGESIPAMNDRSVVKSPTSGSKQQTMAKPADYDKLATGTWKSLSGSKEIVVDNNNPGSQYGAGFEWFPEIVGRDVLARAKVKMTTAVGVGIHVRTVPNEPREFSYVGDFNREQTSSGIAVINPDYHSLGNKQHFNEAVYDQQFFEIAVAAVGDRMSVYIDGKKMVEATDETLKAEGYIGLTAFAGSAIFKDVEVMQLGGASSAPTSSGNFALEFDGVDDYVEIPDFPVLGESPFTIELTTQLETPGVYKPLVDTHNVRVVSHYDRHGPMLSFWVITPEGEVRTHASLKDLPDVKQPFQIAAVFDGQKVRCYINGKLPEADYMPSRPQKFHTVPGIKFASNGKNGGPGTLFPGMLDEIRISKIARYSADYQPTERLEPEEHTLALYHFDEGTGDVLKDSSGNGHDGKIIGAKWARLDRSTTNQVTSTAVPDASVGNFALRFNEDWKPNNSDHVLVPTLKYPVGKSFTLEMWTQRVPLQDPTPLPDGDRFPPFAIEAHLKLLGFGDQGLNSLGTDAASLFAVRIREGGISATDQNIGRRQQQHLAAVFDLEHDEVRFFINGDLAGRSQFPKDSLRGPFSICHQEYQAERRRYAGWIDEVRVSSSARYSENFKPARRFEPDEHTLALYHFDEASGDVLKDSSGNGHHGNIVGAKWVRVDNRATSLSDQPPHSRVITSGDGSVELLSLIKYPDDAGPSADGDPGKMETQDDGVLFSRGALARVPVVVDSDKYEIEWEFTLKNEFQLLLPAGEMLQMLDVKRDFSHFHINGAGAVGAPRGEHASIAGKRTKMRVLVDSSQASPRFTADLNGQKIIEFEPAATFIQDIRDSWVKDRWNIDKLRAAGSLAIIPNGATIHSFKIKLHEGEAKLLRSGNAGNVGSLDGTTGMSSTVPSQAEWTEIFNGKDLSGWETDDPAWTIKDGLLVTTGVNSDKGGRLVYTKRTFKDVHILAECRLGPKGNSGLVVRAENSDGINSGYEAQLTAPNAGGKGGDGQQGMGSLYNLVARNINIPAGTWITAELIAQGTQLTVKINGEITAEYEFDDQDSKFLQSGYIALAHLFSGEDIAFRRIAIRELPPPPAVAPFNEAQARKHQQAWADYLGVPVEKTVILPGGETMEFILIPPGEFQMGSGKQEHDAYLERAKAMGDEWGVESIRAEHPPQRVGITQPFYLGKFEVTQAQWKSVMGSNPSKFNKDPQNPVDTVSWDDTDEFLNKSNAVKASQPFSFALPTQAQWEFACRAGGTSAWHDTESEADLAQVAWHKGNAKGVTHPVGQLHPNAFGLFDMHGNVVEWCSDWLSLTPTQSAIKIDPTGPPTGKQRILRGGHIFFEPGRCRAAYKAWFTPDDRQNFGGFRLAMTIDSAKLNVSEDAPPPAVAPPAVAPFDEAQAKAHQKAWADYLGESIVTTNSIGMKLAVIPPGEFKMGEGENAVDVTLTRPLRLGVHEVTQREWTAVMGTEPWKGQKDTQVGDDVAATFVNWPDAAEYCQKLTQRERTAGTLREGWEYRLPTQAEWEFALRSGTTGEWAFADGKNIGDYGWIDENAKNVGETHAHVVGQKKPSPWGLYDLHGNVWEWCSDWNSNDLQGDVDPQGPSQGSARAHRGGSWHDGAWYARSPVRHGAHETARDPYRGFRLTLAPAAGTP